MKKKIFLSITGVLLIVLLYFGTQIYWLLKTDQVPYRNLREVSSASCYVAFNVEHDNSLYKVVASSTRTAGTIRAKSKFHEYFYLLYMNEVIKYNLSVPLDDLLFSEVESGIVENSSLNKFEKIDFKVDTTIITKQNELPPDLRLEDKNAIIYLMLQKGINCCIDDLSGRTFADR